MPFRRQLSLATQALLDLANADGGIPAVRSDHASGCWTSADVLYDVLTAGSFPAHGERRTLGVIRFLLRTQLAGSGTTDGEPAGGWPLAQGTRSSTMATGQAVAALLLAERCFDEDPGLTTEMRGAIERGFQWLSWAQNPDGGWGTEPAGGGEGVRSTILATFYALLAYITRGDTAQPPGVVRSATGFLRNSRNAADGSWSARPDLPGDASNTARALSALIRSHCVMASDPIVVQGLAFLSAARDPESGFWEVAQEPFFYADAGGYIHYHQNSICDVLVAYSDCEYYGIETQSALIWLLSEQLPNGLWPLSSPKWNDNDTVTWSTAEWILAIDSASRSFAKFRALEPPAEQPQEAPRRAMWPWVSAIAVLGALVALLSVGGGSLRSAFHHLSIWWHTNWLFQFAVGTVVVGLVIGLLTNYTYDAIKAKRHK